MKQFIVDRQTTPGTPSLVPVAIPKMPVYDTEADLDADFANLAEGQMASYPSEGANLSVPVDKVESGDMHAVTSNAVAESLNEALTFTCPLTNGGFQSSQSIQIGKTVLLYCDVVITSGSFIADSTILQNIPKVTSTLRSATIIVNDSNTIAGIGDLYANAGDTDLKLALAVASIPVGSNAFLKLSIKLIYQTE